MTSPNSEEQPLLNLSWDSLTYTVPADITDENGKTTTGSKKILKDVSGAAAAGRLTAIMGPSGAGKTTLMNAIAGRLNIASNHTFEGTAFVNDSVFLADYKKIISFVTQDDIVMAKDTPKDAFYFSYRMRSGASADEAEVRVEEMLAKLSLTKCADTILGLAGVEKGVSGGEKKRVNIGTELINNPQIMFLDEPTTGLDSVNADRIGELLQTLAHEEKRTVICTIHTPSSELFARFDDVLLLSRGHVIYHGSCDEALIYFKSIGHPVPPRVNPSEHYMKVLQLEPDVIEDLAVKWKEYTDKVGSTPCQKQAPDEPVKGSQVIDDMIKNRQAAGFVTETGLLFGRSFRNTLRDPQQTIGRLIQILIFSIFIGLFFLQMKKTDDGVQDRTGGLFLMAINTVFLNLMPALAIFPLERSVFLHEQSSASYSAVVYYVSKFLSELPILLALPTIYISITYWMSGLVGDAEIFFTALLVILCTANVAQAFGFMCAALFPSPQIAMTITPLLIMPMFLVAGLFANTDRLEPGFIWLNYISFPRFSYKALMLLEFGNIGALCEEGGKCRWQEGSEVLKFYGFDKDSDTWENSIIALLCINVAFRIMGAVGLAIQARLTRSRLMFEDNFNKGERPVNTRSSGLTAKDATIVSVPKDEATAEEENQTNVEEKPNQEAAASA